MALPYVGEIRLFAGNYAPFNWMFCNGTVLPISGYQTLYNLIGTTYGGNGQTTFNLPDLRSRFTVGQGTGLPLGMLGGTETVTLNTNQIPAHTHVPAASSLTGSSSSPAGNYWAAQPSLLPYIAATGINTTMNQNSIGQTGGNTAHDNMIPFLVVSYIIAVYGIYPTFP